MIITNVQIVRPKQTGAEIAGRLIGAIAGPFFLAWIAMLLFPIAVGIHPGYWQTLAGIFLLRALIPTGAGGYRWWTKEAK